MTSRDLNLLQEASLGGPNECGGYKPWVWCIDRRSVGSDIAWLLTDGLLVVYRLGVTGFTSIMLIVMVLNSLSFSKYLARIRSENEILSALITETLEWWEAGSNFITKRMRPDLAFCIFTILWIVLISLVLNILQDFRAHYLYSHDWSFGQIVAILIWVPPLAEWLNVEIRGLKKGLQSRVVKPYIVTIEATSDEGHQESSDVSEGLQEASDVDEELQAVRNSRVPE